MNLAFVAPSSPAAVGCSPMQRSTAPHGARFEVRDGFNIAVAYGSDPEVERRTAQRTAGWADVSHMSKLELQGPAQALARLARTPLELGTAARVGAAWWCPLTPTRALVIGAGASPPAPGEAETKAEAEAQAVGEAVSVIDVTTTFAALTIVGPKATDVFARFSALDLRPQSTPVGALRPGSIARQPAILLCEAPQRYLFLFGSATAEYVWSVVTDAGHHLGGRPIGTDALALVGDSETAEAGHA